MTDAATWAVEELGYRFRDAGLLRLALTHSSMGGANNERLEFLGDAVLGLVVAEAMYQGHPDADEGSLSRLRVRMVRRETLEAVAREVGLGDHLILGASEIRSGGHRRGSNLANALEAVFGAVFLDSDWGAARDVVLRLLASRLTRFDPADDLRDPKTRLQEFLQGRGEPLPAYVLEDTTGAGHEQRFEVVCRLEAQGIEVRGEGASRRAAEQQAAGEALRVLGAHD